MTNPVWLEVAVNGGWTRDRQPLIPVTSDEIVADAIDCIEIGASIVHFHAYDPASGRQSDSVMSYLPAFEGIRAAAGSKAIVYPTIAQMPRSPEAPERYAAMIGLAERGLLEWAPIDPGTVNFMRFSDMDEGRRGYIYVNSDQHIRAGLALAAKFGIHPNFAIYEPGFVRMGAALALRTPELRTPIYRFMFTGDHAYGYPVRRYALDSYVQLLKEESPRSPWMVAGRGSDITPLIGAAVEAGGHVRVGLEDAPLGSKLGNRELVELAAEAIVRAGGRLATAEEVRNSIRSSKTLAPTRC
jgi:3-keto-5-aminohexanoate cleavage enzyme